MIKKLVRLNIIMITVAAASMLLFSVKTNARELLTEPMLQNATKDTVTVQWFTEGECEDNHIILYETGRARILKADSSKLSRIRGGKSEGDCNDAKISQDIWKHVVVVDNLKPYTGLSSERVGYRVISDDMRSGKYSLSAAPSKGTSMKVLLTSDLQLKNMCAANLEKVYETVGRVDAIFSNGDIVDVPDRCYDWFYADNSFYKVMTGKANDDIGGKVYHGAPLIQYAPLYTSIGNHDVMGVYDEVTDLSVQFNSPNTRDYAYDLYARVDTDADEKTFIENNSYNTITYEEMFELPVNDDGGEKWYATTLGDIRLVNLDVSRVWRLPNIGLAGKYSEWPGADPDTYSHGEFIFEPIKEGSSQLNFLRSEVAKSEFTDSKIKVVMFHAEAHSLGNNQIPAFTDPVPNLVTDPFTGLSMMTYDYPIADDYINKYLEPVIEKAGTNLLFNAHSHLWNRFKTAGGMNVLQTSNIGNTYGAFLEGGKRGDYPEAFNAGNNYSNIRSNWNENNYILSGDPYGLEPVYPNISSLPDGKPYLSSNEITAFSILDTGKGTVDSYYFDTTNPDSDVILFDSFEI